MTTNWSLVADYFGLFEKEKKYNSQNVTLSSNLPMWSRILGSVTMWPPSWDPTCLSELCISSLPRNLRAASDAYRKEQQHDSVRAAAVKIGCLHFAFTYALIFKNYMIKVENTSFSVVLMGQADWNWSKRPLFEFLYLLFATIGDRWLIRMDLWYEMAWLLKVLKSECSSFDADDSPSDVFE